MVEKSFVRISITSNAPTINMISLLIVSAEALKASLDIRLMQFLSTASL